MYYIIVYYCCLIKWTLNTYMGSDSYRHGDDQNHSKKYVPPGAARPISILFYTTDRHVCYTTLLLHTTSRAWIMESD